MYFKCSLWSLNADLHFGCLWFLGNSIRFPKSRMKIKRYLHLNIYVAMCVFSSSGSGIDCIFFATYFHGSVCLVFPLTWHTCHVEHNLNDDLYMNNTVEITPPVECNWCWSKIDMKPKKGWHLPVPVFMTTLAFLGDKK